MADAVFAPARFDVLAADVLFVAAAFVAPRLAVVFLPDLPAADEAAALVATRSELLVFPLPAVGLDLDDFLRVFLDIRLPFVAFSGVFWDSREPRPDH
ncbi:hypothetical protein HNQ36_001192 [Afipia massiliensis]|uniref:Uncharacterized protein n=1 Tax=Afipia massiliensis TaxID=211460 RepID=A0A840MZU0_9BRAD|nr:hypothetical protein [Afipia massiliensis]